MNALLDAEADTICRAQGYERSPERVDGRADHYERKLETKAGEVRLRVPPPHRSLAQQRDRRRLPLSIPRWGDPQEERGGRGTQHLRAGRERHRH